MTILLSAFVQEMGRWNTWYPVFNGYIAAYSLPIRPLASEFDCYFHLGDPLLMHVNFSAHRCGFVLHSMGTEFVSSIQESLSTSPLTPVSHECFMCSGLGLVDGRVLNSCFSFCIIFREILGMRLSKNPLLPKVSAVIPWCFIFWSMWCTEFHQPTSASLPSVDMVFVKYFDILEAVSLWF